MARQLLLAQATVTPIVLLSLGLLTSCGWLVPEDTTSQPSASPEPEATPELTYQNITITDAEPDGRILWKLTATLAQYNSDQTSATLDTVTGEFFDQDNQAVKAKAQAGSVYTDEKRFELDGNVQIQSLFHQFQLSADRVEWYPEADRLVALDNVTIAQINSPEARPASPDIQAELTRPAAIELIPEAEATWVGKGDQLIVDFKTDTVTLTNLTPDQPIEVTAPDPGLLVTATQVDWNFGSEILTAQENVDVVYPDQNIQLTGNALTAQLTEDRLTLEGNTFARSSTTQQELKADQLDWTFNTSIIEASGNVEYQQPTQNLSVAGTEATFNWQANTVAVRGGSTTTQLLIPQ